MIQVSGIELAEVDQADEAEEPTSSEISTWISTTESYRLPVACSLLDGDAMQGVECRLVHGVIHFEVVREVLFELIIPL